MTLVGGLAELVQLIILLECVGGRPELRQHPEGDQLGEPVDDVGLVQAVAAGELGRADLGRLGLRRHAVLLHEDLAHDLSPHAHECGRPKQPLGQLESDLDEAVLALRFGHEESSPTVSAQTPREGRRGSGGASRKAADRQRTTASTRSMKTSLKR